MKITKGLVLSGSILILIFTRIAFISFKKAQELDQNVLFYETRGQGNPPLILLHGLFASHTYWSPFLNDLSTKHQVIVPDLLGFGNSLKPDVEFTVAEHISYIKRTIEKALPGSEKVVIVGHSMGAILALNYASSYRARISGIVLINPPIVDAPESLIEDLRDSTSATLLKVTFDPRWAKIICRIHEYIPGIYYPFIRLLEPDLPPYVVSASTQHTWESFSRSFNHVLQSQDFLNLIHSVGDIPILLISSKGDPHTRIDQLDQIKGKANIKLISFNGGHNFLLQSPAGPLKEILAFIDTLNF